MAFTSASVACCVALGLNGYLANSGAHLRAQVLALAVQLGRAERAQQAFHVGDGIFQQLLHRGFDVALGIDAEGLRHLARVDIGLCGVRKAWARRRRR